MTTLAKRSLILKLVSPSLTRRECQSLAKTLRGTPSGPPYAAWLHKVYLTYLNKHPQYNRCTMCSTDTLYLARGVCPTCGHVFQSRCIVTVGQKRKSLHASLHNYRSRGIGWLEQEVEEELQRIQHHDDSTPYRPTKKIRWGGPGGTARDDGGGD